MTNILSILIVFISSCQFVASFGSHHIIIHGNRFSAESRTCWRRVMTAKKMATDSTPASKRGVRDIISLIESRYGNDGQDWKRTKMYVYRAKKLSLKQVTEVLEYLDSFLSPEIVTSLLKDSPRILNKSVESYLKPTHEFLFDLWGEDLFKVAMNRNPKLLLTSGVGYNEKDGYEDDDDGSFPSQEAKENVEDLLCEIAGVNAKNLKALKKSNPFIFRLNPPKVQETLAYLATILEPITKDPENPRALRKLILGNPFLLNLGVETNLKPRVEFLTESLKLNPTELAKIVHSGGVLSLSIDKNLKPTLQYLRDELQLDENLKKSILAHPPLLALSLDNLRNKATFFHSIGTTLAPRIARRCPAVFSLSLDTNIIPTLQFLSKIWGCEYWQDQEMEPFLADFPNVLTLSVEGNLQPTMNFFNRTGYTHLDDEWNFMGTGTRIRGRYIACSLYQRLLPRWHYCVNQELQPPPLHVITTSNDAAFCISQTLDLDDFIVFQKEAIPRLKFSSQFDTWLKTGRPIDI